MFCGSKFLLMEKIVIQAVVVQLNFPLFKGLTALLNDSCLSLEKTSSIVAASCCCFNERRLLLDSSTMHYIR